MKRKHLALITIFLILSSFLLASMLLGEGGEPMVTLLDGHSQSHYNMAQAISAVHPASYQLWSAVGQAFTVKTAEETYKLTQAKFYLKRVGSPTGHLKACLYNMTGTYGTNAKPTGSPLASSELVDITNLGLNYSETTFSFVGDQQYEVTKDQKYCIVVQANDGSLNGSNRVNLKASYTSEATHDGNECWFASSGWLTGSSYDLCFLVYGEYYTPPPPPPTTLTIHHDANGDTNPLSGSYEYDEPEWVTVTYTPDDTFKFQKWVKNGKDVSQNPINVYLYEDINLYGYGEEIPPPAGEDWIDPDSFEDPDSKWTDEPLAYDNNTSTGAITSLSTIGYTSFLILKAPYLIYGDKLRFYVASTGSTGISVDIDVFRGDEWVDVYEGAFANNTWYEKTFDAGLVTKMRIRFHRSIAYTANYYLYEFDFYGHASLMPLLAKKLGSDLAVMLTGSDKGKVAILL